MLEGRHVADRDVGEESRTRTIHDSNFCFYFIGDDVQVEFICIPENQKGLCHTDLLFGQEPVKLINARNSHAPESNDDVTFAQARVNGRAVLLNRDDHHAGFIGQTVEAHDPAEKPNILAAHADVTTPDPSVLH